MSKNKKWLIGTIVLFFVVAFVYFVFINNSNTNNNVEAKTNITLKGNEYLTIEIGNDYEEKGAEALDSDGNDITDKIEITGFVDITKPGIYKITYTIIDSDNNKITKIREVKVIDTIKPTVVFETNGSNIEKQTHQTKVTVEDIGGIDTSSLKYLWSDSQDQPKEEDFFLKFDNDAVISNTETKGIYYLWIIAKDESGNTSIVMSNGFNFNYTPQSSNPTPSPVVSIPEVTLLGSSPVTIEVGSSYVDAGAIADDEKDGVLVPVATTNLNANEVGTYYVTYTATNSAGKQASKTRIINVVDTTKPVITLSGESEITIEVGSSYVDAGATALDNYDGILTTQIEIDGTVDEDVLGTYTITYNVEDSSGNQALEVIRTVKVEDTTIPVITLAGDSTITIEADIENDDKYVEPGVTALDNYDEDITTDIVNIYELVLDEDEEEYQVVLQIDTSVIATYRVRYNVTDSSGNDALEVIRTVKVEDTTIPVITLAGDSTITIEADIENDDKYVEPGVTALDNIDGDITENIVTIYELVINEEEEEYEVVEEIDTSVIATYRVRYNVTDSSGNDALEVIRTVYVVDSTAPDVLFAPNGNSDYAKTENITVTVTDEYAGVDEASLKYLWNTSSLEKPEEEDFSDTDTFVNTSSISTPDGVTGTYYLWILAKDNSDNTTIIASEVFHLDNTAPEITLLGSSPATIFVGDSDVDAGATALDNIDGDITENIVTIYELVINEEEEEYEVVEEIDTSSVATYRIRYNVTDSSGNEADEVIRIVSVVEPE